jgi:DUF4097 and DUF4098 domain-containing protein YvlB
LKEEIKRINKLVAEGKLSPEDAADLIDAFYTSASQDQDIPPTPPREAYESAGATEYATDSRPRDPFKNIIDSIEKLGKEVTEKIDWNEVSEGARSSAKKGLDALKAGLKDVSKGRFDVGWLFSTATRELRLPFTITDGQSLSVENGCGDVTIVADSVESYVVAKAKVRGATIEDAKAKADVYTLVVEGSDHGVVIRQPQVSGLEVDLEIHVAATPAVDVKSDTGDVVVRDTKNSCRIKSTDGGVDVRGVSGVVEIIVSAGSVSLENGTSPNLYVENKSGDVTIRDCDANMNVRCSSGNIAILSSKGKTIAAEAVSGNVTVDLIEPVSGTVNVRTVSGNAHVQVADGSDARVALTTLRGVTSTDIELTDRAQNDQRVTGRLGDGTGTIDVSAVTGNVELQLRRV